MRDSQHRFVFSGEGEGSQQRFVVSRLGGSNQQ